MGFVKVETKVDLGIITSVIKINKEIISYRVFLENHHQENERADGIPIFSFGYNSYTYLAGSRVVCLIKDSNVSKVFIIGQTYDPAITRGGNAARPGETQLSSGGADRSGIAPLGANDIFHAYTEGSYFKFDSKKINISISDELVINGSRSFFSLSTDTNNSGFSVKNGTFNISAINGLNVFANNGAVYIKGQRLAFYEGANKKEPDFLISNGLHRQTGAESLQIFGIYSFEAGSSKVKGKKFVVDWNLIQGSYGIRLGTGDFKINLTNVSGAEVSFKIGVGPLYLSQFIFDQSALEVKIGGALPDSLKLGGGELNVKVGNIPGLQTELLLEESNSELKVKGITGNSTFTHGSTSIKFENNSLTTGASASFEIASGDLTLKSASKTLGGRITLDGEVTITGELIVKDKIYSTGEIFAKATVTGDTASTTNAVGLSTHKHPTAVPGPVSSPTPGT